MPPVTIFLIITLNSLSHILLVSVSLGLLWFIPVLSFGIYFSVFSFSLTLCVCFSVLVKSAISLALDGNGFMKKRFYSALQYTVRLHLLLQGVSPKCVYMLCY